MATTRKQLQEWLEQWPADAEVMVVMANIDGYGMSEYVHLKLPEYLPRYGCEFSDTAQYIAEYNTIYLGEE